ncbi:hypothetical protein [Bradyrhizobium diazoefficiens]|uniref:hypothetical protein n=1 Tax=Bradyrhizobium diazoefficiens TaxID=1355477 RepID=UPI0013A588B4|nr:hypothetical protein [Bradyrhizobium diazoefficiens]QJS40967.1 hypothetical protein DI395_45955 [Bradyrhizobium diazoefficiens]
MDATATALTESKKKEAAGRTASLLWIATGTYYFASTEAAAFLSWQAALFFIGGMFGAALVFGAASHYLFAAHQDFYLNRARGKPLLVVLTGLASLLVNLFEIGAPIVVARWAFLSLYGLI